MTPSVELPSRSRMRVCSFGQACCRRVEAPLRGMIKSLSRGGAMRRSPGQPPLGRLSSVQVRQRSPSPRSQSGLPYGQVGRAKRIRRAASLPDKEVGAVHVAIAVEIAQGCLRDAAASRAVFAHKSSKSTPGSLPSLARSLVGTGGRQAKIAVGRVDKPHALQEIRWVKIVRRIDRRISPRPALALERPLGISVQCGRARSHAAAKDAVFSGRTKIVAYPRSVFGPLSVSPRIKN